jgi:hypothetical protein
MSEREYFSLRYAVPGFTFVLLVVWLNLGPILKIQEASAIFGGFVALFSGSAIGFLISQVWWRWFHWQEGLFNWKPIMSLRTKYDLKDSETEDQKNVLLVFDYIVQSSLHTKPEWNGLSRYCYRRWDTYVLFSCTMSSLILGTVVGMFLRIIYEVSMSNFLSRLANSFWFFLYVGEFWILVVTLVSVPILWVFLKRERAFIKRDYEGMHSIFIKRFAIKPEELKGIFEKGIFKPNKKTESK